MNLEERFLAEYSPKFITEIEALVAEQPALFDEMVPLFYKGPYRLTQWVSNAMLACVKTDSTLFIPHLGRALKEIQGEPPVAITRNLLRIIKEVNVPEEHQGIMTEVCFELFGNIQEPITIRYYAMCTIYNIVREIPELGYEFKLVLEAHLPYAEKAILSKGRKILEELGSL